VRLAGCRQDRQLQTPGDDYPWVRPQPANSCSLDCQSSACTISVQRGSPASPPPELFAQTAGIRSRSPLGTVRTYQESKPPAEPPPPPPDVSLFPNSFSCALGASPSPGPPALTKRQYPSAASPGQLTPCPVGSPRSGNPGSRDRSNVPALTSMATIRPWVKGSGS